MNEHENKSNEQYHHRSFMLINNTHFSCILKNIKLLKLKWQENVIIRSRDGTVRVQLQAQA